ncbi:serine hydrolase domain-containing protein [Mycolicibacterium mageritense]|uniref:serine hydrolase domain-containing protein n=2 Tax=Mycolicibacterium TaxID=1866885 RepID=UPI0023F043E3|nr:serine hydrolase [Mycolicibacterium mageritense]
MLDDTGPMTGFPPAADRQVTLANWQQPEFLRWGFQHLRELLPTQRIAAPPQPRELEKHQAPLGDPPVIWPDGTAGTAEEVFAATYTDALLVLRNGRIADERYCGTMTDSTRHLLMSVSKSLVGCVAGILVDRGQLDPAAPVTEYVPDVADSGYRGATVRNVLDMRTGVAFREAYTAADSEVRAMERSVGWAPMAPDDPIGGYAYLRGIGSAGPHGGEFTYRSCDTDMLGWVCERAAGVRMADLISTLIWQPMGAEFDAEVVCDAVGTAVHDGGVCATLRDLGRFGQLLLDDGTVDGQPVVPAQWLADTFAPGADVRAAFADTENEPMLPGGWYRNQFWFYRNASGPVLLCLGIHGQLVYVDRASGTVVVKMSSWPTAQDATFLAATLRACGAIAASG